MPRSSGSLRNAGRQNRRQTGRQAYPNILTDIRRRTKGGCTMQHRNQQQESHLLEITRLLSMYHALSIPQLGRLYPELTEGKLLRLLGRLKSRAACLPAGTETYPLFKGLCSQSVHHCRLLGAPGFPGGHHLPHGQRFSGGADLLHPVGCL